MRGDNRQTPPPGSVPPSSPDGHVHFDFAQPGGAEIGSVLDIRFRARGLRVHLDQAVKPVWDDDVRLVEEPKCELVFLWTHLDDAQGVLKIEANTGRRPYRPRS